MLPLQCTIHHFDPVTQADLFLRWKTTYVKQHPLPASFDWHHLSRLYPAQQPATFLYDQAIALLAGCAAMATATNYGTAWHTAADRLLRHPLEPLPATANVQLQRLQGYMKWHLLCRPALSELTGICKATALVHSSMAALLLELKVHEACLVPTAPVGAQSNLVRVVVNNKGATSTDIKAVHQVAARQGSAKFETAELTAKKISLAADVCNSGGHVVSSNQNSSAQMACWAGCFAAGNSHPTLETNAQEAKVFATPCGQPVAPTSPAAVALANIPTASLQLPRPASSDDCASSNASLCSALSCPATGSGIDDAHFLPVKEMPPPPKPENKMPLSGYGLLKACASWLHSKLRS